MSHTSHALFIALCVGIALAALPLHDIRIDDAAALKELITEVDADDVAVAVAYRLPNTTRPIAYAVHLHTNVHSANFEFHGVVRINLTAIEETRTIVLHRRQLTIRSAVLFDTLANASVAVGQWQYDAISEHLSVPLATSASSLVAGSRYMLELTYVGELRDTMAGFYRSSYVDEANNTRWLATTQFQTTDARHAFPCYDEPAFRATFDIKITHGSSYFALSNMPVDGEPVLSDNGQLTTTTFATTPSMPTYVVAFIVSDFATIETANERGFVQRVFARPNAIGNGDFGLQTGVRVLDALQDYFQVPYALPKMDQVAVPDFAIGAMENWGLVTYRENRLLYNASADQYNIRLAVARMIAHEFVHQWFGNHVTLAWWSYAWLNEGFATLYEYKTTDWLFPTWRIMDNFGFAVVQQTMLSDATGAARPMSYYAESPGGVAALFDFVTYGKSGSVLRMFMDAFTEASFKKGLIAHLNKGANSTASEVDLFAAIADAVAADHRALPDGATVATIMASWTRNAGFPILRVERNYTAGGLINLHQQRYHSVNTTDAAANTTTWWIPYNVATAGAHDFDATAATHWLGTSSATVNVSAAADEWLLLNKRQTGYYRVQYDRRNYALLADALRANLTVIHLASRSQLVDDLFEFVRAERIDYALVFDVIRYLEHETEAVPWSSAFRGLELLDRLHAGSAQFTKYQRFVGDRLLAHVYGAIGVHSADDEHVYRKQIRPQVVRMACQYGLSGCLRDSNAALRDYLARNAIVHHDQRAEVLCGGVRNATTEQYASLWQRLQTETEQQERYWLIDALACTPNRTQLTALAASSTGTADNWHSYVERYRVLYEVMANHAADGVSVAFAHLSGNLAAAEEHYTSRYLNSAVVRLASMVNSAERKAMFDELIAAVRQSTDVPQQIIDIAEESVRTNLHWVNRNQATLEQWIETNAASSRALSAVLMGSLLAVWLLF